MDCQLIERARKGDREAFALIVDGSFDRCYEVARRILGESHLAQDATQAAMVAIWRELPKLRDHFNPDFVLINVENAAAACAR